MSVQQAPAFGHYESSLAMQFLPGCSVCGHRHPLAHTPPLPPDRCPACGAPAAAPGAPVVDPAVVTDGRFRLGNWLMRIGKTLKDWSERL